MMGTSAPAERPHLLPDYRRSSGGRGRRRRPRRAPLHDTITGHVSLGPLSTMLLRIAVPAFQAACRGFDPRLPLHFSHRRREKSAEPIRIARSTLRNAANHGFRRVSTLVAPASDRLSRYPAMIRPRSDPGPRKDRWCTYTWSWCSSRCQGTAGLPRGRTVSATSWRPPPSARPPRLPLYLSSAMPHNPLYGVRARPARIRRRRVIAGAPVTLGGSTRHAPSRRCGRRRTPRLNGPRTGGRP